MNTLQDMLCVLKGQWAIFFLTAVEGSLKQNRSCAHFGDSAPPYFCQEHPLSSMEDAKPDMLPYWIMFCYVMLDSDFCRVIKKHGVATSLTMVVGQLLPLARKRAENDMQEHASTASLS